MPPFKTFCGHGGGKLRYLGIANLLTRLKEPIVKRSLNPIAGNK